MEKRGDFRVGKSYLEDGNLADHYQDFDDLIDGGMIKIADLEKINRRSKKARKNPKATAQRDETRSD